MPVACARNVWKQHPLSESVCFRIGCESRRAMKTTCLTIPSFLLLPIHAKNNDFIAKKNGRCFSNSPSTKKGLSFFSLNYTMLFFFGEAFSLPSFFVGGRKKIHLSFAYFPILFSAFFFRQP
jgi:hypothetical protein